MKLFFALLLILFGSFLIGLTVDSFGKTGNFIMHLIGTGFLLAAIFIGRRKLAQSIEIKRHGGKE